MGVLGLYLIEPSGEFLTDAKMHGKICTAALLDAAMLVLLLFHRYSRLTLSVCC